MCGECWELDKRWTRVTVLVETGLGLGIMESPDFPHIESRGGAHWGSEYIGLQRSRYDISFFDASILRPSVVALPSNRSQLDHPISRSSKSVKHGRRQSQ